MPISGSLRILVYLCVYREQLLLTFYIQINLIFYKKKTVDVFLSYSSVILMGPSHPIIFVQFHKFLSSLSSIKWRCSSWLSWFQDIDPQEIPVVQKQKQKRKTKQNKTKADTKKENRSQRRETVLAWPQTYAEKWYVLPHLCCSCFNRDNEGPRKGPCRKVGPQQVGASHLLTEHWKPKDEQDAEI